MSNLNVFANIPASHADCIRTENWCYTKGEEFECEFTWVIHDIFSTNVSRMIRSKLQSCGFSATNDSCEWHLRLRFREYGVGNYSLCINLFSCSDSRWGCAGNATVSLMDSKNEKLYSRQERFLLEPTGINNEIAAFNKLINYDNLIAQKDKLLPNGELRIYCKLSFNRDVINVSSHSTRFNELNPMHDFEKLFKDEETCDFTININGKKYPAHKTILAARSPVFKAMLQHDMAENRKNSVEIKDIDEKLFEEVLRYIYTGKVTKLEHIAFELIPVADKYDLGQLKDMCFNSLKTLLSGATAVKMLIHADQNNLPSLKTEAIKYILGNLRQVQKSAEWNDLISRPDLMASVLNHKC